MSPERAVLCLGSNLGDRQAHLACGRRTLTERGVSIENQSRIYETEPTDVEDQPWFLNQAVAVRTDRSPDALWALCADIERHCGRRPSFRFGPRILDIDILLYGDRVIDRPALRIPHPRLRERRFMLEPLLELDPAACDPRDGHSFRCDLEGLDGKKVTPFKEHGS
jgi:2-amino-4-hydroxy-6-hydroxymethyldihydropteridine diphosphokinase